MTYQRQKETRGVVEAMVDGLNDHEIEGMEKFFSDSFRWIGNAGCGFKKGLREFKGQLAETFSKSFF
ncbi:MAG: hypothetical protein Ct9H300mP28_10130 [Pseudomonadota bacterium]|nr:MAG: hypothetical protein Ct9H300mP28_10130 [Pseudomonadota bacterium]